MAGSATQTARANDVLMACRFNAKKEKVRRCIIYFIQVDQPCMPARTRAMGGRGLRLLL